MTRVDAGRARIVGVTIEQTTARDIILINVYMPCRGKRGEEDEYSETLDQLAEILYKYRPSHEVLPEVILMLTCNHQPTPEMLKQYNSSRNTACNSILIHQINIHSITIMARTQT